MKLKTRTEKIEFLKSVAAGLRSVDELQDTSISTGLIVYCHAANPEVYTDNDGTEYTRQQLDVMATKDKRRRLIIIELHCDIQNTLQS
jgi:hypothetical protein